MKRKLKSESDSGNYSNVNQKERETDRYTKIEREKKVRNRKIEREKKREKGRERGKDRD